MDQSEQVELIYFILGIISIFLFSCFIVWILVKITKAIKNKILKLKCKHGFNKWIPVYIKGEYNKENIKFISCFCDRCRKGYNEVLHIGGAAKNKEYSTYSEKYFNNK